MKKTKVTFASALQCMGSGGVFADSHEAAPELPNIVPVETWTCNFQDGKTMADLDKAAAAWNEWMDDEDIGSYFAAIVTPNYFGEVMFDVAWLGAWKDGNAMGTGTDLWVNEGGDVGAQFNEVCNWESHTGYASMNIRRPGADEEDDKTFVLSFSNCSIKDGKSFDDVMVGMNAWKEHQDANGFQASTWMMFPIYGESNSEYSFKLLEGHDNHAAFGADFELMGNGGHWVKSNEIFEDLLDCDIARVYDARTVRDWAEEDDG